MTIDDRFNTISSDPVTRLIEVSQQSLDRAMLHREKAEIADQHHARHAYHDRDLRRIHDVHASRQINDLRQEVAQLRRTINNLREDSPLGPPNTTLASPPQDSTRKTESTFKYVRYEVPPAQPAFPAPIILPLLQTNTGSLIDLLA